jgi:hypothetical protein
MSEAAPPPVQGMPEPRRENLLGNRDYAAAVDTVIARTMSRIRVFDRSLGRDYNSDTRCEALRSLLLADRSNRVRIVVHDVEHVRRDCPRLVALLRHFGHGIAIHRTTSIARGVYDAFCIADGSHYARRFHFDNPRGVLVFDDYEGSADLVQRFEEIWEASQPAVLPTTLGL